MLKLICSLFLAVLMSGCASLTGSHRHGPYTGIWAVRYLPPGKEGLEFAMQKQPLPSSAEPEIAPFGDQIEIDRRGRGLHVGDMGASVKAGSNGYVRYSYAIAREQSEFGFETLILSPSPDGTLYGVWSRIFWGMDGELPPMVTTERFVLERQDGEQDKSSVRGKPRR